MAASASASNRRSRQRSSPHAPAAIDQGSAGQRPARARACHRQCPGWLTCMMPSARDEMARPSASAAQNSTGSQCLASRATRASGVAGPDRTGDRSPDIWRRRRRTSFGAVDHRLDDAVGEPRQRQWSGDRWSLSGASHSAADRIREFLAHRHGHDAPGRGFLIGRPSSVTVENRPSASPTPASA